MDYTVVNSLAASNIGYITKKGAGAAANAAEARKLREYPEYADKDNPLSQQYQFLPFGIEATGALGDSAKKVLKMFERWRKEHRTV